MGLVPEPTLDPGMVALGLLLGWLVTGMTHVAASGLVVLTVLRENQPGLKMKQAFAAQFQAS